MFYSLLLRQPLRMLQVAERKHKPTVLEFMEPLIDQTVPGNVEEEYAVRCCSHAVDLHAKLREAYPQAPSPG